MDFSTSSLTIVSQQDELGNLLSMASSHFAQMSGQIGDKNETPILSPSTHAHIYNLDGELVEEVAHTKKFGPESFVC